MGLRPKAEAEITPVGGHIAARSGKYPEGVPAGTEGELAGEHLKQHRAERENVAAPINGTPYSLFGRHICRRAQDHARKIDLIQVHNLGDVPTQLKLLKDLKAEGRVRYFGVTTTSPTQYNDLIRTMKAEPLDFIGVNYAIDDRDVEQTILPLARDRKIAVLAYAPFGRTRLFRRVQRPVLARVGGRVRREDLGPVLSQIRSVTPVVTAATPATSQAKNMVDNIGGGIGRMPDEPTRKRMVAFVDALPSVG